jgi:UMF1 family MFS transporter
MRRVGHTLTQMRRFPVLVIFLVAFLFYNDGMQTVISQSTTLAVHELKFSIDELFLLVLFIQLVALPGALLMGWLSDRIGQKPTLLASLCVWIGLLIAAVFVNDKTGFWIMGAVLSLVMGGTQSVSRAMMGVMTPTKHAAEFFGFFNFSGKAASVLGPLQFGIIVWCSGSPRLGAVSLLVFFLIGGVLLLRLDVLKGRQQAEESS